MNRFAGKIILITGASSGIGAEAARRFAHEGAHVLLLARSEDALNSVKDEIVRAGGRADVYPVDLADYPSLEETVTKINDRTGTPDVIFNNAGGGLWRFVEETSYQDAFASIAVPYLAAFMIVRAFLPGMLKRNSGHIVNMTSFAGVISFSGATAYVAGRKAMIGLHEALTADLYGTNIKTSLSYFAKVSSPFWRHNPGSEERLPKAQKFIPVISPQQAATAIVDGVAKGKTRIKAPFMLSVIEFWSWAIPPITRFIMNRSGYRRPAS